MFALIEIPWGHHSCRSQLTVTSDLLLGIKQDVGPPPKFQAMQSETLSS